MQAKINRSPIAHLQNASEPCKGCPPHSEDHGPYSYTMEVSKKNPCGGWIQCTHGTAGEEVCPNQGSPSSCSSSWPHQGPIVNDAATTYAQDNRRRAAGKESASKLHCLGQGATEMVQTQGSPQASLVTNCNQS